MRRAIVAVVVLLSVPRMGAAFHEGMPCAECHTPKSSGREMGRMLPEDDLVVCLRCHAGGTRAPDVLHEDRSAFAPSRAGSVRAAGALSSVESVGGPYGVMNGHRVGSTQPPPVITADTSTPTKIIPATAGDPQGSRAVQDRLANAGKEQIVSKQEEPVAKGGGIERQRAVDEMLNNLKVASGGFKRNNDGLSSYDNNEWILVDLLIANAFLDLLPMPQSMPKLLSLTKDLAWLTINFDGVTSLEPAIEPALDEQVERLYHKTMDARLSGGDSRAGRHLFGHLREAGAQVIAAGASDWVVYATGGKYPPEEAYFLQFILHFIEEALGTEPGLDQQAFAEWLRERRAQIERGELVYIAHQMDFLARAGGALKARQEPRG